MSLLNEVTLTGLGTRVPGESAMRTARIVHDLFSNESDHHFGYTSQLTNLAAAMADSLDQEPGKHLNERDILLLTKKGFIREGTGSLALRVTMYSLVTQAMVVPDIENGQIAAFLREPFVEFSVLDDWHSKLQAIRDARRRTKLRDNGFADMADMAKI